MGPGLLSGGTQLVLHRLISVGGKTAGGGWVELSPWGETSLGSDVTTTNYELWGSPSQSSTLPPPLFK